MAKLNPLNWIKSFFSNIILNRAKKYLIAQILLIASSEHWRDKLIRLVNVRVDIPNMNENQEKRLFTAIWDSIRIIIVEELTK